MSRPWPAPYEALVREGLPFGEAMWRAKECVRRQFPNDPTWLAYCCFGDPLARVERRAGADG
jgi:hypothetical protein